MKAMHPWQSFIVLLVILALAGLGVSLIMYKSAPPPGYMEAKAKEHAEYLESVAPKGATKCGHFHYQNASPSVIACAHRLFQAKEKFWFVVQMQGQDSDVKYIFQFDGQQTSVIVWDASVFPWHAPLKVSTRLETCGPARFEADEFEAKGCGVNNFTHSIQNGQLESKSLR